MKVVVSGASGLIGRALWGALEEAECEVVPLVRGTSDWESQEIPWAPAHDHLEAEHLEGVNAFVHLAGSPVVGRWSARRKREILDSRTGPTHLIARTLASMDDPPKVLISASAVGAYGSRGDEWLDESSERGRDFLANVCLEWEQATGAARAAGIRVVHARFGIAMSPEGGALEEMLWPFSKGLGGPLGDGRQWVSWIHIRDLVRAIRHAIFAQDIEGPLNVVAPNPVRQAELAEIIGRILGQEATLRVPPWLLRLRYGQMADALLFASQRVKPERLEETDFEFHHPHLEPALRGLLADL